MRLCAKVAVVTGSGQAIGRGIAERFACQGEAVVLNDLEDTRLRQAEQAVKTLGSHVLAVRADISRAADVANLFRQAQAAFGTVDILVNNTAWASPISHFLDMTEEFWDTVLNLNLKSVFLCSQRAARIMAEQKQPAASTVLPIDIDSLADAVAVQLLVKGAEVELRASGDGFGVGRSSKIEGRNSLVRRAT